MKTILIVDDMAIFREPLAVTLRQRAFNVLTAVNGQEALRVARTDRPDLILLDAAMPVMDGITFCQHAQADEHLKHIPIIMLTAIADRTIVQKALKNGVADYLLKTQFTTDDLFSRIERQLRRADAAGAPITPAATPDPVPAQRGTPPSAAASDAPRKTADADTISAERALTCVREHMQLRSIKPVLQHVLALTRSASSTFDEIAGAIRHDQALAIRVMKVANSSYYRTGKPATSLRDAEQRIGLSGIRNLTTAILAISEFADANPAGIVPQRFWEHALATATLAERISEKVGAPHPEDTFLSGLLHDLGRLVLSDVLSGPYAQIIEDAKSNDRRLHDLERERFQVTHADITREILTQWKMPAHVIEAAVLHHQPISSIQHTAKFPRAALSVALANSITHALLLGDSGSETIGPLDELANAVGLDGRALDALAAEAVRRAADATLFYAVRSEVRTLDPLATTLSAQLRPAPRVLVAQPRPSILTPVELMLGQLGWLDRDEPNVVLIGGDAEVQVRQQLRAVESLEQRRHTPIPVVWISSTEHETVEMPNRNVVHQTLPCRYTQLIEAVVTASSGVPAMQT
jgi:HD-like signal output (HDOD) protein/ActR/RegA family two-component response regulator